MEVIAGLARGIRLQVPPGEKVRPTAVRARKALFDSLGSLEGCRAADLCAGAGSLGLEAASRGASEVVFVEQDALHCRVLERNLEAVSASGVRCAMKIIRTSMQNAPVWCMGTFDLIFADPPYAVSAELFDALCNDHAGLLRATGALLVWEIPDTPGAKGAFMRPEVRFRKFGATEFLFWNLGKLPQYQAAGK